MTAPSGPPRIHLSVPHMGDRERTFVAEAFDTNWLSTVGPNLDAFEAEVAELLQGRKTLAVSSGTAALHLVLRAIGVGPGDRVALATLTFAGSLFPILYLGAVPVLLDSEETSWNLDPDLTRDYLTDAARRNQLPRALVVVHLYGQHANLDPIAEACAQHGVTLVEDAAESLGATYRGRPTACTADYAILSFNGNKIITTTGGGMAVTTDAAALARMRKWAHQAREPAREYLHTELGYNYRMSNVLAGIGRGQLPLLGERVRMRQAVFDRYVDAFQDIEGLVPQSRASWGTHTRWLSVFSITEPWVPDDVVRLIAALDEVSVEARPVWRPMHTQPLLRDAPRVRGQVAESLYRRGVCLPSSSSLQPKEQERVIAAVRRHFRVGGR